MNAGACFQENLHDVKMTVARRNHDRCVAILQGGNGTKKVDHKNKF
jgi:hypothetical protein